MKNIPFITIQAKNNYDLGFQIGKKLRHQIKKRLIACKKLYKKMGLKNFAAMEKRAMQFLPATAEHFPHLVAEAEGLSTGAGAKFSELMVLICEEEVTDFKIPKCTSIAVKYKQNVLLAHNEDWLDSYTNNGMYILKMSLGKHNSLSLNYMGTLAGSSSGLNSNGLCYTANSLNPNRFRYGIPIKFQFRAILEAENPHQAIKSDLTNSSIAGNTIYGWKNSRIFDIEDYFGHHEIFENNKFLIHTNHPLLKEDQNKSNTATESIHRLDQAKKIFEKENRSLKTVKKILADHKAKICSHKTKNSFWGTTIASVIMNPQKKWLEVCWSNPCKNKYFRYYL